MKPIPRRVIVNLVALSILFLILWIDEVIFRRWFHLAHWRWYLEHGVEVGFVAAAVSLVWKEFFESNLELVSAEPIVFYTAHLHLIGACVQTFGAQLESEPGRRRYLPVYEIIFAAPLLITLVVALVVWMLVVVPAQYFVVLVCGAPARVFASAPYQLVLGYVGGRLVIEKIPRGQTVKEPLMAASLSEKPVTVTNLFVSLLLLVGGYLIKSGAG